MATPEDPATVGAWQDHGFSADAARAWLTIAPGRFTPWTASQWIAEGFGPQDAALWSEAFTDPKRARARRSAGYTDPFDPDDEPE